MIPTVIGIVLRYVFYKGFIKSNGMFGVEENVQICHAKNLILGRNVFVGRNSYLGASAGGIIIDDGATILDNCYLNVFNYNIKSNKSIVIHENVVLSHGCVIHGHSGVEIGKDTIVGPNTVFVSGNHGDICKDKNYRFEKIAINTPIKVGEKVWIGTNVTILPGITIGNNAVIGAGAVVTKDIPGNTVQAGNPAKKLREIESRADFNGLF